MRARQSWMSFSDDKVPAEKAAFRSAMVACSRTIGAEKALGRSEQLPMTKAAVRARKLNFMENECGRGTRLYLDAMTSVGRRGVRAGSVRALVACSYE